MSSVWIKQFLNKWNDPPQFWGIMLDLARIQSRCKFRYQKAVKIFSKSCSDLMYPERHIWFFGLRWDLFYILTVKKDNLSGYRTLGVHGIILHTFYQYTYTYYQYKNLQKWFVGLFMCVFLFDKRKGTRLSFEYIVFNIALRFT